MKHIILSAILASLTSIASAAVQPPIEAPTPLKPTVQGCFSSAGELQFDSTLEWMSSGKCGHDMCMEKGFSVAATTEGTKCYCGNKYPPKATLSDPLMCNISCTGFGEGCGGLGYYTVYNTGKDLVGVEYAEDSASNTSPSATTAPGGETVMVTVPANNESNSKGSSGPNTAGIAAGVVVGVVAVAGLVGGFFWYMRRRRNQEIEDEHRRNAVINGFVSGGKPPSSSGGWSNSDSRLDPVMAQRRMSSGSIADNQDYSRKILRVTNA